MYQRSRTQALIDAAIAAEREACARAVETAIALDNEDARMARRLAAAVIRARSEKQWPAVEWPWRRRWMCQN